VTTSTKNLSRKGLLRVLIAQNDALLAGQSGFRTQLTSFQETVLMALNAQGQAIADQINTNTNKLAAAQTAAVKTISDLVEKLATGTIDAAEFATAVAPSLRLQGDIADALLKTATDNDPAVNPGAPPIVVQPIP
jgi:hypothetical protein